jgi:steroid delta-isomerase-like uncharacterized protein
VKAHLFALLSLFVYTAGHANDVNTYKQDVRLWYEAFNRKDSAILDRILSADWIDIPAAPGQPTGLEGAKKALVRLTTVFPDFAVTVQEILQDGDKVIVRSQITGTQNGTLKGLPAKHREVSFMAIDIHDFKDGRIVRTWHCEDWLTGLRQLGLFDGKLTPRRE